MTENNREVHILEVKLRLAVTAADNETAVAVAKEVFQMYSDDGSLSDMFVYEWDDPIHIRTEETATE